MPPVSAIAPSRGASSTISSEASELPNPSQNVLVVTSVPALQYCLKNSGKKPAMTVVAKAELAQS